MSLITLMLPLLLVTGPDNPQDAVKKELDQLQGDWVMLTGEHDGAAMPPTMVETARRTARGNETTITIGGQVFLKAGFTIDPTKNPKTIDYDVKEGPNAGKRMKGIYEIKGDQVKFCFSGPEKEPARPFCDGSRRGQDPQHLEKEKVDTLPRSGLHEIMPQPGDLLPQLPTKIRMGD